ncbi:MAG: acetyl-CoA decarbonylase/synthase complex subunit delta [Actinobacteria bacterium]|nr:acetyl-CoA decarbonylase/synthase complex subunit delta [Actinomycetota bacterium]
MAFEAPVETAKGSVIEVVLNGLQLGGQTALPFHWFEGEFSNPPRVGFEVWDVAPTDWAKPLAHVYSGVWSEPVAWARMVVEELGAEAVYLKLMSTDPNGLSRSIAEAAGVAEMVADAIDVPLAVVGPGAPEVDAEVVQAVAPRLEGRRVLLGPASEENYRAIGAAALGYGHGVIASSPIDINLAKQLNVLLTRLGLEENSLVMDPTTGALGYGLEYSYSVFERTRLAALFQNDQKMQLPIVAAVGEETWKAKESRAGDDEMPGMGVAETRGILWEAVTGLALSLAGADLLILRHPRSAELLRATFADLGAGGAGEGVAQ